MMDTSEVAASTESKTLPSQLDVGMMLREARERLGMSVNDVAERIKFAPRQVEALEANDFAHLPQATFLRGFVRSYSRVLQLDEVALIAALPTDPLKQVASKPSGIDVPFPAVQALRRINLVWLAGALGVALLLGLFIWWHEDVPQNGREALIVEPIMLPASEVSAASAVPEVEMQVPEPLKEPEPVKIVEPKKVKEPKKAVEPVKAVEPKKHALERSLNVAPASAPVAAVPTVPLDALKRRPLHFVFVDDAWAEVKDANGVVLLARMNRRGSEQWIGGPRRAPYAVSISRPGNVKLYYKGKELDLSDYAAKEVANLKVE